MLEIITNNYLFTMTDPEQYMRKLTDLIGDILKRYKSLTSGVDFERIKKKYVVRNLALGISAGAKDLKDYTNWLESTNQKSERIVANLKNLRKKFMEEVEAEKEDKNKGD